MGAMHNYYAYMVPFTKECMVQKIWHFWTDLVVKYARFGVNADK